MTLDGALPEGGRHGGMHAEPGQAPLLDTTVANHARVYNYLLGGKDNFAIDRAAGEATLKAYPAAAYGARANRAFLRRAVRFLAAEAKIRQFLDIGTGIPTADNTHEVAQAVAPACRIVYVDNDPVVLAHARALLTSSPEGATDYLEADLRDPKKILAEAARTLDFSQPVAVMVIALLHVISDDDDPYGSVAALIGAVPSGSYLAVSHVASDIESEKVADAMGHIKRAANRQAFPRTSAEVTRFFHGLELVEPGLVQVPQWRSEDKPRHLIAMWAGVGRKP